MTEQLKKTPCIVIRKTQIWGLKHDNFQIEIRQELIGMFLYSLVYMSVHVSGYVSNFWPIKERDIPEIWYTHSPRPYVKTGFVIFFETKTKGPASIKNYRVTMISQYLIACLVSFFFILSI